MHTRRKKRQPYTRSSALKGKTHSRRCRVIPDRDAFFFFLGVLTLCVHCALRCDIILPLFSLFDLSVPLLKKERDGQVPLLKLKLPSVHGEPAVISNGARRFKCTFSANSYFGYPKQRAPGSPISKSRQIELCLTMKCLKIVTF